MKKNMRVIYDLIIEDNIKDVDEINEDDIEVISILKEHGIFFQKEIRKKFNPEKDFDWIGKDLTCLVIYVEEENYSKAQEYLNSELIVNDFKFSDLPEDIQKQIREIPTEKIKENVFEKEDVINKIEDMKKQRHKYKMLMISIILISLIGYFVVMPIIKPEVLLNNLRSFLSIGVMVILFQVPIVMAISMLQSTPEYLIIELIDALMKPARYSLYGEENLLENTIYAQMFDCESYENENRISMDMHGEIFVAEEFFLLSEDTNMTLNSDSLRKGCIKAKTKKNVEESMFVEITSDKKDSRKVKIKAYKNGYQLEEEEISEDFIQKAQELYEKNNLTVSFYYIADVVTMVFEKLDLNFKKYYSSPDKLETLESAITEKMNLIRSYIELAEWF